MDPPDWNKFDLGLLLLYSEYLRWQPVDPAAFRPQHPALQADAERVHLLLEYTGSLQAVEAAGFATTSAPEEGLAEGVVQYADLAALSLLPQVQQLVYGQEPKPALDTSIGEIRARGSQGAWTVDKSGKFTGDTGEGVLIGIIDSGIDWQHPNFLGKAGEGTRILRIWDMGLEPQDGEKGPAPKLLTSPPTYGVEYTKAQLDAALQGDPAISIRHRDCNGHGTHVAGIAAGNGQQPARDGRPPFELCGVAPRARLVVVKMYALLHEPSTIAGPLKRFKDAFTYILRVAAAEAQPVAINCSFGFDTEAGDGLDDNGAHGMQTFLNKTFTAATPGRVCVFSAGNNAGGRTAAQLTIPDSGSLEVPLEVFDQRTVKSSNSRCINSSNSYSLVAQLHYHPTDGVKAALQTPAQPFSKDVSLSLPAVVNQPYDGGKRFSLHVRFAAAMQGNKTVVRHHIDLTIDADGDTYQTGDDYRLRLQGPPGTVFQLRSTDGGSRGPGLRLPATLSDDLKNHIKVNDRHTIGAPGDAASVITVAAYDDTTNRLACFSSRGPLADYSTAKSVDRKPGNTSKPDIAAPGVNILSSHSRHASYDTTRIIKALFTKGPDDETYEEKSGTSMAAPHVTGVVALMLGKNPQLTPPVVKDRLHATARPGLLVDAQQALCDDRANPQPTDPPADITQAGFGKVDAKAALQAVP